MKRSEGSARCRRRHTPPHQRAGLLAAPGRLAQLLVGKYCDHLSCYRQEQLLWQRHGVFIARQQMVHWTAQSVRLLSGISDCLKRELQGTPT